MPLTTLLVLTALWAVTICEIITFTLCGALMYHWVGNQYMTAPAFGSLQDPYKKIAFSFAIPTIVFLGSLYSSVTARFVFFRLFRNSRHLHSNTVVGWASWVGILAVTWILAFIISEVRLLRCPFPVFSWITNVGLRRLFRSSRTC